MLPVVAEVSVVAGWLADVRWPFASVAATHDMSEFEGKPKVAVGSRRTSAAVRPDWSVTTY